MKYSLDIAGGISKRGLYFVSPLKTKYDRNEFAPWKLKLGLTYATSLNKSE